MDFLRSKVLSDLRTYLFGRPNMRSLKARQVAKDKGPAHHRVLGTYSAYESIEHTLHMGFLFLSGFSHRPIRSRRRQDTSAVIRAWMSVDELHTSPKSDTKLQTSE